MALVVTLGTMALAARQITGRVGSGYLDDTTELYPWINEGIQAVWKLLTDGDPDRGLVIAGINTTAGTAMYDLPERFYKIRGLDLSLGGDRFQTVFPFPLQERNHGGPMRYRVIGGGIDGADGQIWLQPAPGATHRLRLLYVEAPPTLTDPGDEFDGIIGFHRYPILFAAIQIRGKAQEDATLEQQQLAAIEQSIVEEAARRDVSGGMKVARVRKARRAEQFRR